MENQIFSVEDVLEEYAKELAGSRKSVRSGRLYYARSFLEACKGDITAEAVRRWWKSLERRGLSPSTVRLAVSIAKRVVKIAAKVHDRRLREEITAIDPGQPDAAARILRLMNLPRPEWPLPAREMPKAFGEKRETFTDEEARAIVLAATDGKLEKDEAAFTALASVYGMRQVEIRELRPEQIDLRRRILRIETAKHGQKRYHLIPNELVPYLEAHDFATYYSEFSMWRMFKQICQKAGVQKREQLGWHSWRRYIDSSLSARLPRTVVRRFLRWKEAGMEEVYFTLEDKEVDEEVFQVHPLLPIWRQDGKKAKRSKTRTSSRKAG
jgi:integrase